MSRKFPPQLRSLNAQVSVLDVIKQNCLTQLQSQRTTELKIQRQSFLMKITHFTHRSTDRKTVVEWSLLLDLQGHNPQIRVRSRYHWIFRTNHGVLWENLLPFCRWKLDRPSRTKKRVLCLLNQWKNRIPDDIWCCEHPWLWLADLHVKVCLIGLDI